MQAEKQYKLFPHHEGRTSQDLLGAKKKGLRGQKKTAQGDM